MQHPLIDQRDPWSVFDTWLNKHGLSFEHIAAIRELSRNLGLLHIFNPAGTGQGDYSFLVAAIGNDWEAELLLTIHGYPSQALALVRGTYEKLAWLKLFLSDPKRTEVEFQRSLNGKRPLFGKQLIVEAFGEAFFHDLVEPLNRATHADLARLAIFHRDLEKETPEDPAYRVGPNYGWQYSFALFLVLQSGATWALSCLETLENRGLPRKKAPLLFRRIIEVVDALRQSGLAFSSRTDEQIRRLQERYGTCP